MSRIEQVIAEIEEFVDNCKTATLSNSMIKVNKEEFKALLNELREEIPEEVMQSQKIVSNKDNILMDAKIKAEKTMSDTQFRCSEMYEDAKKRAEAIVISAKKESDVIMFEANKLKSQMVNENQIMQTAYDESGKIIEYAQIEADRIVSEARNEANNIRHSSIVYADELLQRIQGIISGTVADSQSRFNQYLNSLQFYTCEIDKNRQELAVSIVPVDPNKQG